MTFDWRPFAGIDTPGDLPRERRHVMVAIAPLDNHAEAVAVGYLRYAAGDKGSPYFVVSGFGRNFTVTHWCDCLGDEYSRPGLDHVSPRSPGKTPARIAWEHQELTNKLSAAIEDHESSLAELKGFLEAIKVEPE